MVLDEGSESLEGMFVSKDYFRVVGLEPLLGRTFSDAEASFPPAPVIVIGYDLWQRKFGGDPDIVGTKGPHEPPRHASNGHRRDATRCSLPAFAGNGAGAELQRQRPGRFLDADGAETRNG